MEITGEFIIQKEDIDWFNHLNNKRYFDFFEAERSEWFTKIGFPYLKMAERDQAVVIVKLDMDYIKEVRLGERVTVKTFLEKAGTKSFTIEQSMYNEGQEEVAKSSSIFVMFDLVERKSMPVVEEIAKFFPNVKTKE